jgi:branched-chain amino acid transport system ATP-binding protein
VVDTVFDALEAVKSNGTAILLVEQRAQLTVAFADRTYVLRDGKVTHELTAESASDDKLFTEAYFGS